MKEADLKKDALAEADLITKEKAEAQKLWDEIKKLPGNKEIGDIPAKKELLKKLWAVKKQMWEDGELGGVPPYTRAGRSLHAFL